MSHLEDDPQETADKLGLRIVEPLPSELFVDIDSPEALAEYCERLTRLHSVGIPVREFLTLPSKTEGHCHIYLAADRDLSDAERIALQSVLGSDPLRELLGMGRILLKTDRVPSLFFETEENWAKVQEAREKLDKEPEADPDDWSFSPSGPVQEEPTEQPPRPEPTMMGCGHTAQAIDQLGSPVCVICFGVNPGATAVAATPDLAGRTAQCAYGNHKPVPSAVSLPFFAHKPGAKFDEYYCGCFGWD